MVSIKDGKDVVVAQEDKANEAGNTAANSKNDGGIFDIKEEDDENYPGVGSALTEFGKELVAEKKKVGKKVDNAVDEKVANS